VTVKPLGERLAKQAAPEAGNSDPKQRAFGEGAMGASLVTSHWSFEVVIFASELTIDQ
jgi:hypothetical protein